VVLRPIFLPWEINPLSCRCAETLSLKQFNISDYEYVNTAKVTQVQYIPESASAPSCTQPMDYSAAQLLYNRVVYVRLSSAPTTGLRQQSICTVKISVPNN
jgi:hypothetical protein